MRPEIKPRIRVLSLGGTWCMRRKKTAVPSNPLGQVMVPERLGQDFDFRRAFPIVEQFCTPDFRELEALDSSNMAPSHWTRLCEAIAAEREDYDGFVVLQGTDTLAFTAAALSFALNGFRKPVILSGAQLEMDAVGSDALNNVINACRVAALQLPGSENGPPKQTALPEVAVVFGSSIIRGTRCRKYSERDLEAFSSVNVPVLGHIRTTIRLNPGMLLRMSRTNGDALRAAPAFDARVVLLHLYPGMNPDLLLGLGNRASGVVIAAFGAGNIPCSTDSFDNPLSLEAPIRELAGHGIPVVVTTQCVVGQAEHGLYETGSKAKEAGAIIANDMTPEVGFTKLAWLLANEDRWPRKARQALRGGPGRMGAIRTAMLSNLAGEITENPELYGLLGP